MTNTKDVPKFLIAITTVLIVIGVYMFLQGIDNANNNLPTEAILLIGASLTLLFFAITPWISIFLVRLKIIKDAPDVLSGGSDEQLGAGIALGLLFFLTIGSLVQIGQQSVLTFPTQTVFSQVSNILTLKFWQLSLINIAVPFAEELFFIVFLPTMIFGVVFSTLKKLKVGFPVLITSGVVFFLDTIFFAFFHVFMQSDPFALVASIIFRTMTLILIYSDQFLKTVPFLNVGLGVTIGIHVANNILNTSNVTEMIFVLLSGDGVSDITSLFGMLFLSIFVIAFIQLFSLLSKILTGKKITTDKGASF